MPERADATFLESVESLRGAIRLHCYRMLGSSHDGDDMVQETMVRAWRAQETLSDRAMLRPWLYRIATHACLDELKRRPARVLASSAYPAASDPAGPIAPGIDEAVWLEPMPDAWLAEPEAQAADARHSLKESVALAFVAALQMLSPAQRATLLLRDVVGLSAEETMEALGMTLGAANSALFRARAAVEEKLAGRDASSFAPRAAEIDEELLARYVRAFDEANMDALVALLHDDVKTTMPPSPIWIDGLAANELFYRTMFKLLRPGGVAYVRTGANGHAAYGFYRPVAPGGPLTLHAIQLVTTREGKVATIDHFRQPAVLPLFGLPVVRPSGDRWGVQHEDR
jgi:RNA polymerase sigma-70 factor (ECF subfamily)